MFKSLTSKLSLTNRPSRSITAAICAVAMATVLSGTAAAFSPTRDLPDGGATAVTPRLHSGIESTGWIDAKLKTTAGYKVLVLE